MNTLIGLLIIAIGNFGQSSSYVPINRVRGWSRESFWLIQGVFAWLVFSLLGALLTIPAGSSLIELWGTDGALSAIIYDVLWGVGGLTFKLSMCYLGVALGRSIALGACAGFGTLSPALFAGKDSLHGNGLIFLISVCITLAGIAVAGYAGSSCSKNMSEEERKAVIEDFTLTKGLLIALLAGVMSARFALGLDAGAPIRGATLAGGVTPLYAGLPVIFLVTLGGFFTNAVYCIQQNIKDKIGKECSSVRGNTFINNPLFCALTDILWYSQFFGPETGKSSLGDNPILLAFFWNILMSLNMISSNVWEILLKEQKGCGPRTIGVLLLELAILVTSIIIVAMARVQNGIRHNH